MRLAALVLLLARAPAAGPPDAGPPDPGLPASPERFVPAGWEVTPCPPAHGADAVLCAATDTGPLKVDHHVPTAFVRARAESCATAARTLSSEALARGAVPAAVPVRGTCEGRPCTELSLRMGQGTAPAVQVLWVVCTDAGHVLVPAYAVSQKALEGARTLGRARVGWQN